MTLDLSQNTLVSQVMEIIRENILSGEIPPGKKIDQDGIAAELGVSRMPVREALVRLEEAGYVILKPYRGAIVAQITRSNIEETYLIRTRLETLAVRIAAERMNDAELKKIEAILEDAGRAIQEDHQERLFDINRNFHRTIYEVINMPRLFKLIEQLRDQSEMLRHHHVRLKERSLIAFQEHKKILEALRRRDPEEAEHWMQLNLENSAKALLETLPLDAFN